MTGALELQALQNPTRRILCRCACCRSCMAPSSCHTVVCLGHCMLSAGLLGDRLPGIGNPSESSFAGHIRQNMRSGRMFPCAPVSTLTFSVAGTLGLSAMVMFREANTSRIGVCNIHDVEGERRQMTLRV